ncbi:hypothetical protein PDN31_16280 [Bacillus cereus]|nr:hypothetical protein [Bacillus cereus]MDA2133525.1 hypothetical protein [Bacillus cereus]
MVEYIFKRFTPLKKDIFDLVINEMLRVGWKQLNEGKENAKDVYVMYSNGNDGHKNIFIELIPYDAANIEGYSTKSKYDVRTSIYSDPFFKFCTGYNSNSGRGTSQDFSRPVSWFTGRRGYNYTGTDDGPAIDPSVAIELFIYIDKEKIILCTIPPVITNLYPTLCYLGVLDNLILEEIHEPYTRALVWYSSAFNGLSGGYTNIGLTFAAPKNGVQSLTVIPYQSNWLKIPSSRNPNVDSRFIMTPFYIYHDNYGIRGKLGGIFTTSESGIVSGDILEVEENGKIKKYKYIYAKSNIAGALPAPLTFRIE